MGPKSVQDLEVWRAGIGIVKEVYALTQSWPREELYGLTSQARHAAVSIPTNLAEGAGRHSAGDFSRFVQVALGSIYELDTLLEIAAQLGYAKPQPIDGLRNQLSSLTRRTNNFIHYQQSKRRTTNR